MTELALVEWALQESPAYHGLSEATAEMSLYELQYRMWNDSLDAHKFLSLAEPHDLEGELIPQPGATDCINPNDYEDPIVKVIIDMLDGGALSRVG